MVKKVNRKNVIQVEKEIDVEVYETSDGRQFKSEEEAIYHENVGKLYKQTIKSKIINNEYLTQYIGNFTFVYFENENQVEAYEQMLCGNQDDNTWSSWVSNKEKFTFPCWMMSYYVPHELSAYGSNDYTAVYMTRDEVINDLTRVIEQVKGLE
jgi:hypothetical protein